MYNISTILCLSLILFSGCKDNNNIILNSQEILEAPKPSELSEPPEPGKSAVSRKKPPAPSKITDPLKLQDPSLPAHNIKPSEQRRPAEPLKRPESLKPIGLPDPSDLPDPANPVHPTNPVINPVVDKEKKKKEETFLAPWRALKSELAGIAIGSVRNTNIEKGVKNFLALNTEELSLLLEQDWVWTSLLSDLGKQLAPQLSPVALKALVQTLENSSLKTRVGDLELTLSSLIDQIAPNDPQLLNKLEPLVFGALHSAKVGGSIQKKLLAFMAKNKSGRAEDIKAALDQAIKDRQKLATKSVGENRETHLNFYSKISPHEITKILNKNFRDPNFWSPILASPDLVLHMSQESIETLFQAVVAVYQTDPLPHQTGEPIVVLLHVCRKLDPQQNFENHFKAITKGVRDNPREILLNALKNKVNSYLGASKNKFLNKLEKLKTKRITNANALKNSILKDNKVYQDEAQKANIQPATMAFENAPIQSSIDDQSDGEEKIAGYMCNANKSKLDQLYKQLSRKEAGLKLEHNIKQRLAWALAYLRDNQMLLSLELENFWKLINAYPEIIGFGLTPENLGLLFNKLGDYQEQNRRSNLVDLLEDVAKKLVKPPVQLHETLDIIEKTIKNMTGATRIQAVISKQRSLPTNKRL